jgi:hypothetical protein
MEVSMLKWLCLVAFLVAALGASAAEPPSGAGATWPKSIVADVGDLQIRFESRSFWTLYRVEYRGDRLGIDRFGSHYGTVANFPEIGFIGSGHTENEDERVLSVKLWIDGKECLQPEETIQGESVRLHKRSRIKSLLIETDILIKGDRIIEDVVLSATEPTPVNRIYHFMHPWTPTATEFAAERTDGEMVTGAFNGARDFKVDAPTRWSAVYDRPTGKGAAIIVLDVPDEFPWKTMYWDIDKRYRKHYLVTFLNSTIPPEKRFHYRVAVVPFAADAEKWLEHAARIGRGVLEERVAASK